MRVSRLVMILGLVAGPLLSAQERIRSTADTGRVELAAEALTFSGRDGKTLVSLPRFEAPVAIDGELSEPQWQGAAR
ncbi:MAG: hypothetical protein JNJ98_12120, partial [Gemmatimonadetes bacterium]|nr:hypothetical protein [Gemmatimonadota bacterium]